MADLWFADRHRELLREASQQRLVREAQRARKGRSRAEKAQTRTPLVHPMLPRRTPAKKRPVVRLGLARDAPRIAVLLELNGMPRWVAYEERFIIAEEEGQLVAVVRFREDAEGLHLGLFVTDPWAREGPSVTALYAGAGTIAQGLGLRKVRARPRGHETLLRKAGYRRCRGGWWLDATDTLGRS